MHNKKGPSYLVVNADDYAYFPGVSRGIIEAHKEGIVTATGVLANGSSFSADVGQLRSISSLDTGVHLNLTFGRLMSAKMRSHYDASSARFASKGVFAKHESGPQLPRTTIRRNRRRIVSKLRAGCLRRLAQGTCTSRFKCRESKHPVQEIIGSVAKSVNDQSTAV